MNGPWRGAKMVRLACLAALLWVCPCVRLLNATAAEPDIRRDVTVLAVERVLPSVVNIATETVIEHHDWYEELLRGFYGWPLTAPRQQRSISLGSGVIIDEEGYVLTNFHVVRRASRIQVKLWDGREYEADPLVATTGSDVALIKIRAKPGEKFAAIKFAADDDLVLGETVIAVGNPFGLGGSVTRGILSSKNRRPTKSDEPLNMEDWLQTDAAINPGNSGGPLVNLRGELIGLNVAVYREQGGERGLGVGFSIPVKQVSAALARFFTPEVTDSLWLGAQVKAGSTPLVVTEVKPGGPAARAGMKEGDLVAQVNGQTITNLLHFNRTLVASEKQLAKIVVRRGGEPNTLFVKMVPFEELIQRKLGLTLLESAATKAGRRNPAEPAQGLFVEEVEKDSPAELAGFQRGYLVAGMDGTPTTEIRAAGEVLSDKKKGDTVKLSVVVPRRYGSSYVEFRQGIVDLTVR